MPIGDNSAFSKVDDALWAALRDGNNCQGENLVTWRKEQSTSGLHPGKDFDGIEVPQLKDIALSDCPALVIVDRGAVSHGALGADFQTIIYPKHVVGVLRPTTREGELSAKLKKFAELTWSTIAHWRANNFQSFVPAPNPIQRCDFGDLVFPNVEEPGVFLFSLTLGFHLGLSVR